MLQYFYTFKILYAPWQSADMSQVGVTPFFPYLTTFFNYFTFPSIPFTFQLIRTSVRLKCPVHKVLNFLNVYRIRTETTPLELCCFIPTFTNMTGNLPPSSISCSRLSMRATPNSLANWICSIICQVMDCKAGRVSKISPNRPLVEYCRSLM